MNSSTGAALTTATFTSLAWVSKDGATQAGFGGTFSTLGNGQYDYAPTQAETNCTNFSLLITPSGAVPLNISIYTDNWDTTQPVVTSGTGTDQITLAAGVVSANVTKFSYIGTVTLSGFTTSITGSLSGSVGSVSGAVGSVTGNVGGNVTGSVGSVAGNVAGSVASVVGNVGGNVTGSVGSVVAGVTVTTNNDKTGYSLTQAFPTNFSSLAITAGGAVTVGTNNDKTGYSLTQAFPANFALLAINGSGFVTYSNAAPPSAATIAGAVWDVTLSSHLSPGSTGEALNAAGAAGDPWITALPGAYSPGQAGYIVGTNLDAAVSGVPGSVFNTVVDGTYTFAQSLRLANSSVLAMLSGAVAGASGTVTVKSIDGTKTRFTWNYDPNGNRTGLTVVNSTL